ncbi:DUF3800 domain-containing protein [Pedobacter sp.]
MSSFNIYCDESCHLENDGIKVMGLGAVWFPKHKKDEIFTRIREIKVKHGLPSYFEIKWHKVSPAQEEFYLDLIDYFFDDDDLHFRCLMVSDKDALDHKAYNQTHDDFYYKMYFDLIKIILTPECSHHIYLDIKDTKSQDKIVKLQEYLRKTHYDFEKKIIRKVQHIRSHEAQALQLVDLLLGAITYFHRGLQTSESKLKIIKKIKHRSGYSLIQSTLPKENKLNLFIWKGGGGY